MSTPPASPDLLHIKEFFSRSQHPSCLYSLYLPDRGGFEPSKACANRSRTFRGNKRHGRVRGVLSLQKNLLSICFQFAFNLLSTVQIAREIVRHEETLLRLNKAKERRDRNLETRSDKRVLKLRIRRLGVRIPSRAQVKPRVPFTPGAFLLPQRGSLMT